MHGIFHILLNAPSQPVVDGLKDLTVDGVADGLGSMNGGWYLSSIMLFITIWAVRGRLNAAKESTEEHIEAVRVLNETHTKKIEELSQKHYDQAKEQTDALLKYMQARDAEVKELLQESTATTAEVAGSIGIMANDLRDTRTGVAGDLKEVKDEIRHKLQAKPGAD